MRSSIEIAQGVFNKINCKIVQERLNIIQLYLDFPGVTSGKEPTCQCRRHKRCRYDPWVGKIPLEERMATQSSILVQKILWTEELGRLQSIGSQSETTQHQHLNLHLHSLPSIVDIGKKWEYMYQVLMFLMYSMYCILSWLLHLC